MINRLLDKNGCGNPDIYCWKCSGKQDDFMQYMRDGTERIGKGHMIPTTTISKHRTESVHYECIDCNYETFYYDEYIKEWKIK